MNQHTKIAFGGGCHWCTEAVFQSLKGVEKVEQGFISSTEEVSFSEAVIVHFNTCKIALKTLMDIHLRTHKSTSNHSMREKYRSAIYTFSEQQEILVAQLLNELKQDFSEEIITKILPFNSFKPSLEQFKNYYLNNPNKPFCKKFIDPKIKLLMQRYSKNMNIKTT